MSAPKIAFYFDFVSPYAYLAHFRLLDIAERYGAEIEYHPVDLERLKALAGNTAPKTRDMPLKLQYGRTDLRRWAARYGVSFTPPAGYGSARLNTGFFLALERDCASDYLRFAWGLVWGHGRDMACGTVLNDTAGHLGWDAEALAAYSEDQAASTRYDASTTAAHARGVFGVPTFIIGNEMWWGNDRLFLVEESLAGKRLPIECATALSTQQPEFMK